MRGRRETKRRIDMTLETDRVLLLRLGDCAWHRSRTPAAAADVNYHEASNEDADAEE